MEAIIMAINTVLRDKAIKKYYAEIKPQLDNINREIAIKQAELEVLLAEKANLEPDVVECEKVSYDAILRPPEEIEKG